MSVNDDLYSYLNELGLTGSLNDKMKKHLEGMGYRDKSLQDYLGSLGSYLEYTKLIDSLSTKEIGPNEIVYPYITDDTPWEESSSGTTKTYFVPDKNGDNKAVRITLSGTTNHHQWIDLPSTLAKNTVYVAEVEVNPVSYSGQFEISYRDDSTELVGSDLSLSGSGWQTLTYEFTTPSTDVAVPSIRLLGWGNGADTAQIEIGHISLRQKEKVEKDSLLMPSGQDVDYNSISSYPLPEVKMFKLPTPEERNQKKRFTPEIDSSSVTTVLQNNFNVDLGDSGVWDLENMEALNTNGVNPYFRSHIEAGAYVGDTNLIRGAGWENRVINEDRAIFSYEVRFKDGFDWVKGGKLPGMMGGNSPSGGANADQGFSTRMMWRTGGQGELYLYVMNKLVNDGAQQGTGSFFFKSGVWQKIEQEVVLNDVGKDNGLIRVWIDGVPQFVQEGIIFRDTYDLKIEGIMHTIFFGGGDSTWAATRDEYVDTRNFIIYS